MVHRHQCSANPEKILLFFTFFVLSWSRVPRFARRNISTSSRFPHVSRSGTFPVLLDHVAGLLGDHVRRRVRVTGDYGRHHAGVHDPETVDPVHPQPVVHHPRISPGAHLARARVVTQSRRHVTGGAGPVCVALKSDVLASRERYRQQHSVKTLERLRGSYFERLWQVTRRKGRIKKLENDKGWIIQLLTEHNSKCMRECNAI